MRVLQAALAKLLKAAERLRAAHAVMPPLLLTALESLHSYMLVKPRVAAGDHLGAARLLKRVADSISRFESHAARILTSAVLQCLRAGLPASAHDIATALLRPENREQLQDMGGTYRRKIEGVVCGALCLCAGCDGTPQSCCHCCHQGMTLAHVRVGAQTEQRQRPGRGAHGVLLVWRRGRRLRLGVRFVPERCALLYRDRQAHVAGGVDAVQRVPLPGKHRRPEGSPRGYAQVPAVQCGARPWPLDDRSRAPPGVPRQR